MNSKGDNDMKAIMGGYRCQNCNTDLVFVKHETVRLIKKMVKPNFQTLGVLQFFQGEQYHPICPRCDAYALGLEMVEGFPFLMQSGEIATIHALIEQQGELFWRS